MALGSDRVTEWLKQVVQKNLATPARHHRHGRFEIERLIRELLPLFAAAVHGGAEQPGKRHAEKGGSDAGAVVHVLVQLGRRSTDQSYRIDIKQERGLRSSPASGAAMVGSMIRV